VTFTIDSETSFPNIVVINAACGFGKTVVQGAVTSDEYRVFKPRLDDDRLASIVEKSLGDKEKREKDRICHSIY
jgi:pyruvate,water dikinase